LINAVNVFVNPDILLDSSGGEVAVRFPPPIIDSLSTPIASVVIEFHGNTTNTNNENWFNDVAVNAVIIDAE
jgi:hypothetical protein